MEVRKGGVRHEQVGEDLYAIFAVPEGDHYRWTVTRMDMSRETTDHFGKQLETGTAQDEAEAWRLGKSALNRFLVRTYLEKEFPGLGISEFSDSMRGGRGFRVHNGDSLVALVSDEFLDDTESKTVGDALRLAELAGAMRIAGKEKVVIVTTKGFRTDSRRSIQPD